MAKRIAKTSLNASTIEILNVIRANAPQQYQDAVPKIEKANQIPIVGEVIYGTPAFANHFINELVNRIALVRVTSATFNNPYTRLKKGYLEFGETVEEIFVNIAKVYQYSAEKAESRELKRYLPDVESAFHVMNWRVMYPVTIQDQDLKQAFLSMEGVQDLIAKIVDQIYTAAEYDEFLLFKYMLIKTISKGGFYPTSIGDGTNLDKAAISFRGFSNNLTFMLNEYNERRVKNNTPKSRQIIFMDSFFNAEYDVEVLASAFNMDKADFSGSLFLIDNWTTFDNDRWTAIREESDGIEEVTQAELDLLKNVKAIIVDENWFQVYDNLTRFTEKYIGSGLYWNYFYHVWKTVSYSPFANAICFVTDGADIALPASVMVEIDSKSVSADATVFTFKTDPSIETLAPMSMNFVQTEALTTAGIGVQKYGAILIPASQAATDINVVVNIGGTDYYNSAVNITSVSDVGEKLTLYKGGVEA